MRNEMVFQAQIHGIEVDGGPGGSGLASANPPLDYDPTQGRGTDAWQQSKAMNRKLLEKNAQRRRN